MIRRSSRPIRTFPAALPKSRPPCARSNSPLPAHYSRSALRKTSRDGSRRREPSGGLTVEIQRKIVGQVILAHLHTRAEGLAERLHGVRIIMAKNRVGLGISRAEEINGYSTRAGIVHL